MSKRLIAASFAFLFCVMSCSLWGQSDPRVKIVSAELGDTLKLKYLIQNVSTQSVFVFSPFLKQPFDGIFDRHKSSEVIWATFMPGFKGNYSTEMDFLEIKPGGAFAGEMEYEFGAKQITNCTKASRVGVKVVIGWGLQSLKKDQGSAPDSIDVIAEVKGWQSLATSDTFVVNRSGKSNSRACPAHQDLEIWRY